jgi:uncharacterized protein YndB with AHSA1/START domain
MTQMTDTSVRRSITVQAPLERAFMVFTENFDAWWPRTYHIGEADMAEAVLEQRQGGRWYEKGVDGSECDWGTVLAWDPPTRLVVSWHLTPDWTYDPDPAHASEIEVRFTAEGPSQTRVDLDHRALDRHPAGADAMRGAVGGDGGWGGLLQRYAEVADG